jgi:acetyl esterase/lipase
MSHEARKLDTLYLWSGRAPGALGDGPEDRPRLTPYLPEGNGPFGCVVVCPGGGYGGRAKHEGEPIAQWLCSLGLASCVLDYRVKPYQHPVPLGDAQRAIRMVRARASEWNLDTRRVGIVGFSAGGHLATSAATLFDLNPPDGKDPIDQHSARPDVLIACYPVISFGEFRHHGSMVNLIGKEPDPKLRQMLSLENSVTAKNPPAFLWHTADDAAVPVENVLLFAQALRRHKVSFALHVFPHGRHGLGLASDQPGIKVWTELCAQWLREMGFAPR